MTVSTDFVMTDEWFYSKLQILQGDNAVPVLRDAAHTLRSEPTLVDGSFVSHFRELIQNWRQADRHGVLLPDSVKAVLAQYPEGHQVPDVACHCLEGAVRDAAGVVSRKIRPHGIGDPRPRLLEKEFRVFCARTGMLRAIIDQFDMEALAKVERCSFGEVKERIKREPASVIYRYSDTVLFHLGPAGPKEAARILHAAADQLSLIDG